MSGMLGHATVRGTDPAAFSRNGSSFFADPVAWLVCAAVGHAIEECGDELAGARDTVGVIAISDFATLSTMRTIAGTARQGRVSPLRFAGANPGALAGLACIRWKFHGPALTLSMNPADGVEPALAVANGLLSSGAAGYLAVVSHAVVSHTAVSRAVPGEHVATCVLLRDPVQPREEHEVHRLLTTGT